jgi:NAD+ kinase
LHKIGLLVNPRISETREVALRVGRIASGLGVESWTGTLADAEEQAEQLENADLVFTFGGDGTIIRASKVCSPLGIPIVGTAMGQLGFLAELQVAQIESSVPLILEGRYFVEERIMLHSELWREGCLMSSGEALNDVAMLRGAVPRVIEVIIHIDGSKLTKWVADGAIVSTPTGSTAYSLASGGPVAHPEVRAIILTPVAAHLNILQALVIPETAVVRLTLCGREQAVVSVDGQVNIDLREGDYVDVSMSRHICRLVRLQNTAFFYSRLLERLQRKG